MPKPDLKNLFNKSSTSKLFDKSPTRIIPKNPLISNLFPEEQESKEPLIKNDPLRMAVYTVLGGPIGMAVAQSHMPRPSKDPNLPGFAKGIAEKSELFVSGAARSGSLGYGGKDIKAKGLGGHVAKGLGGIAGITPHFLTAGAGLTTAGLGTLPWYVSSPGIMASLGVLEKPESMSIKKSLTTKEGLKSRAISGATSAALGLALGGASKALGLGVKKGFQHGIKKAIGKVTPKEIMHGQDVMQRIVTFAEHKGKDSAWMKKQIEKHLPLKKPLGKVTELLGKLISPSERYAAFDKVYKTDLYSTVLDSVGAANRGTHFVAAAMKKKLALSTKLKAAGISEAKLEKLLNTKGKLLPEEQKLVTEYLNIWKDLPTAKAAEGFKVNLKKDYALTSRVLKGPIAKDPGKVPFFSKKVNKPVKVSFEYPQAKEAPFPKEAYLTAPLQKLEKQILKTGRSFTRSPAIRNKLKASVANLHLRGETDKAAEVMEWYGSFTGYGKNPKGALGFISDLDNIDANTLFERLALRNNKLGSRVMKQVNSLMFSHWVGVNPLSNIKQALQHSIVAPPELGIKYTAIGEKVNAQLLLRSKSPKYQQLKTQLERLLKSARPYHGVDPTEMMEATNLSSFEQQLNKYTRTLMTPFTKSDINNIRKGFIGGYLRLMDKGPTKVTFEGLLPAQKAYILRGAKLGRNEMAYRHGLIRTLRINFIYNQIDKPELLRGPIGQLIPFTTWSRNQWMRYTGDIRNKNYKTLAKRIAYPLALLSSIRAATGYDIPGAHPLGSMKGITGLQIAPMITKPAQYLARGKYKKAGEEALSTLTPYNFYKRYKKAKKKGFTKGVLGLRKAK